MKEVQINLRPESHSFFKLLLRNPYVFTTTPTPMAVEAGLETLAKRYGIRNETDVKEGQ
jgi:hypothetical protein